MKHLLTILLCAACMAAMGQKKKQLKYWRVEADYVTDCKSGKMFETMALTGNPDYEACYQRCKKWVGPNKLLSFTITNIYRLDKPDTSKGNIFECPKPISFSLDTSLFKVATSEDIKNFHFNNTQYSTIQKLDTVRCWFKEAVVTVQSHPATGLYRIGDSLYVKFKTDSTITECWQHGYVVRNQIGIFLNNQRIDYEYFLYADKTKVTNHVIYYFER